MLSPFGVVLEERFGLDWLFWTRGPLEPPADVAVISLDRASGQRLGLLPRLREWPRRVHAELIDRLVEADAAAIVFDLRLDQPRDPADDAVLAGAIARAGNVLLFEFVDRQNQPIPAAGAELAGVITTEQVHPPIAQFAEAAAGLAPYPLPKVPARVSQFWAFRPEGEPTLPVVALQLHAASVRDHWRALLHEAGYAPAAGSPADRARASRADALRHEVMDLRRALRAKPALGERLAARLADAAVAPQERRLLAALLDAYRGPDSRYLNFYGAAGRVPTVPLHVVLDGAAAGAAPDLAGRVVFVGQSELMNLHDDGFVTAFSREDGVDLSGVEIAATAFANLLNGSLLEPAAPETSLLLLVAFGLTIGAIAGAFHAPVAVPATLVL